MVHNSVVIKTIAGESVSIMESRAVDEDEFHGMYEDGAILEPLYNPEALTRLSESSDILQLCIDAYKTNIVGFGVDFEYDIDIPENEYFMKIDVRAYIRILNNLIQNILTHSGGNKLTLRITENESQAQIAVTDNGIGISPSNLPHIFERMYQCDDSRLADGNGLGLAIVKELVNAHKGEIKVESIPSVGTTFIIMFRKVL